MPVGGPRSLEKRKLQLCKVMLSQWSAVRRLARLHLLDGDDGRRLHICYVHVSETLNLLR